MINKQKRTLKTKKAGEKTLTKRWQLDCLKELKKLIREGINKGAEIGTKAEQMIIERNIYNGRNRYKVCIYKYV